MKSFLLLEHRYRNASILGEQIRIWKEDIILFSIPIFEEAFAQLEHVIKPPATDFATYPSTNCKDDACHQICPPASQSSCDALQLLILNFTIYNLIKSLCYVGRGERALKSIIVPQESVKYTISNRCIEILLEAFTPYFVLCHLLFFQYYLQYFVDMENQKKRRGQAIRRRLIARYKRQLISNSTLHGLKNCFDKKSKVRRTIWTMLLLLALGLLLQKLYESTRNYLSNPFNTMKTRFYEDSMQFPAVSICNLNDMRVSVMRGTMLDKILREGKVVQLEGDEYRRTIRKANHRLKDMLYKCKILGKECSVDDFIQFNKEQGDRCFTYNHGTQGQPILFFNKTGPQHALELTINIEEHEYYLKNDYSGINLILHGQDETPVKMPGIMLSPGFITYIEVKKKKVHYRLVSSSVFDIQ